MYIKNMFVIRFMFTKTNLKPEFHIMSSRKEEYRGSCMKKCTISNTLNYIKLTKNIVFLSKHLTNVKR